LKGALPIVLEFLQAMFGATTKVSHPPEPFGKELADVVDAMIVETIHHTLDYGAGLLRFAHIGVAR
jgi:hypothetical protein